MRYFEFAFYTDLDKIKGIAKERLREFGWYECPISVINGYLYKTLRNGLSFVAYRADENTISSVFSYDEQEVTYKDAWICITDVLHNIFEMSKIISEPTEITMHQFAEAYSEAKRRDYCQAVKIPDIAKIWFYNYYNSTENRSIHYEFDELIIPDSNETKGNTAKLGIYDQSLIRELTNIEKHKASDSNMGNIVHYVVSGKCTESATEIIGKLTQRLYDANRISSRRIEIIHDMEPDVYRLDNHLEEIVENNGGGVVVFDLSEKLGFNPVDYLMTCRFIEKLVKKYRNHCLFIFMYNSDHPGFSYQLLPKLGKYVIPVMVKEGHGKRKAAIEYMRSLIESSEYAEYSDQAEEFMELYPGNDFSQTDVINAFERFESWCINKNILKAYDYSMSDEFMLDRDDVKDSSYDKLSRLVGLKIVKEQIDRIISTDVVEKERKKRRGKDYQSGSMHMVFGGNPGSAKTTVAGLFAGIAKEKGILKSGAFVECGGMDLDGLGCVSWIREAFTAAKGGVLFIDEAYSMKTDTAVTVLIQEMENHRDDVIVILAGYNDRMKDFMKINEGLKSRVPHWIDFPDYTADELTQIFKVMIAERGFTVTDDAVEEAHYIFEKVRNTENFGNGRYVRNLIDRAAQNQAVRLLADGKEADSIKKKELFMITKDDICMLDEGLKEQRAVGTAKRELDEMVGLTSVKEVIRKAVAYYKMRRLCTDKGIARDKASLHMVFTGNPGTAKTTVARLFAEIMKDEKILPTGAFVEVGRADLVGDHVGSTAPLVKRKFKEAQGGVLFIDEAYALCDSYENGFGDEAINTLVAEMENHRDDVIVIFAGYPDPMKSFLERNPGMMSRIAFQVHFDDYSTEELCDITKLMAFGRQMSIGDSAMDKLRNIYDEARKESDYGNGRFVRKMLEEAEMNLAERIAGVAGSEITEELITTIDECDIPEYSANERKKSKKIGFAC